MPRTGAAGPPAKKKSIHASQRDTPAVQEQRAAFREDIEAWDVRHFKFLDETSVNTSLTRAYGRAAPGERVVDSTPLRSGSQTTTVAVLGWGGVTAPLVLPGAMPEP